MPQPNDLSRSLVALDQNSTIIAVVELSQSSWLVGGVVPGIERQPCKKLEPSPERLLAVLHRWRDEAGTHAPCEPDKGDLGPAGHSQLQTNPAQGGRTSGNRAHPGGHAAAAKCFSGAAARHGAAGLCCQPNQGDRGSSSETIRAAA